MTNFIPNSIAHLPRFPELMHQILNDAEFNDEEHIISWLPSGRRFKVHNTKLFAQVIMPRYFNHDRYKSFLRQLSLYEFRRGGWKNTPGPKGSYDHPFFIRGRLDLADSVLRVKNRKKTKSAWSVVFGDDMTSSGSTRYTASVSSSSTISTEKYLDPNVILKSSDFSWDILEEIIHTFSKDPNTREKTNIMATLSSGDDHDTSFDPYQVDWDGDISEDLADLEMKLEGGTLRFCK